MSLARAGWALPRLGARATIAYRIGWWLLFAAAIAVTAYTLRQSKWDGPERLPLLRVGINYTRDAAPGLLVWEVLDSDARRAGIRPGDRIVGLMDEADLEEGLSAVVDAADGTPVAIVTRDRAGAVHRALLGASDAQVAESLATVGLSAGFMAGWTLAMIALASLFAIGTSALLYRQRANPVAALLAVPSLIAGIAAPSVTGYEIALDATALAIALQNIGILAFPDGRFATRVSRLLVLANLLWLPLVLIDPQAHGLGIYPLIAASALAMVWRYRKATPSAERQQVRWAALGFAGAALFAGAASISTALVYHFNDLRDVIVHDMIGDGLDLATTICLWSGLSAALLRFRLYDADLVITRSSVWAIAAPLLAFVFAALSEVLKVLLGPVFDNDGVAVAVAGVVTASLVLPLGERLQRVIERWSRAHLIALGTDLPEAVRDLGEKDDRALLLDHVCRAVAAAARCEPAAIAVAEDGGWAAGGRWGIKPEALARDLAARRFAEGCATVIDRDDPLFPLRVPLVARPEGEARAVGWLLLGRRPDGSLPDRDARAAIEKVAPAVGHALVLLAARERRAAALLTRLAGRGAAARRRIPKRAAPA